MYRINVNLSFSLKDSASHTKEVPECVQLFVKFKLTFGLSVCKTIESNLELVISQSNGIVILSYGINEINFELYCALQEKDIPIVSFRLNILLL